MAKYTKFWYTNLPDEVNITDVFKNISITGESHNRGGKHNKLKHEFENNLMGI